MQIFLPYADIIKVAQCLDKRRLHKQIVECNQIIKAITGESEAWKNHPVVKMYSKHLKFVYLYLDILQRYWNIYKSVSEKEFEQINQDLLNAKSRKDLEKYNKIQNYSPLECYVVNKVADIWEANIEIEGLFPDFLKGEFFATMRGRLYKKDPIHYSQFASDAEFGDKNMYFVDGEWKIYKQK